MGRIFAATRMVTGGWWCSAYVYDNNKVIAACTHQHRRGVFAEACAQRLLRRVQRRLRATSTQLSGGREP